MAKGLNPTTAIPMVSVLKNTSSVILVTTANSKKKKLVASLDNLSVEAPIFLLGLPKSNTQRVQMWEKEWLLSLLIQ